MQLSMERLKAMLFASISFFFSPFYGLLPELRIWNMKCKLSNFWHEKWPCGSILNKCDIVCKNNHDKAQAMKYSGPNYWSFFMVLLKRFH